ncbi:MAG: hypothetical protein J6L00_01105 [Clostridia bacterium]|nr:hypothetical protein [Clostridia bacterium]
MKKLSFKKWLLLLCAVYAVLITVGLLCFRGYLKRYEASHPVGAMNGYFAALAAGDTDKIIEQSGFPFDAYNTKDAYVSYLSERYNGGVGNWQYALMDSTDDTYTYDVYENHKKMGTLILTRDKDTYAVRSDWAYGAKTKVQSPQTVLVNGVPLTLGDTKTVTAFAGAKGTLPTVSAATVETLKAPALSLDGVQAVQTAQKDGSILVTEAPKDVVAIKAFAETAAKTYALYISNDLERGELTALMESGTPFASGVYAYDGKWYNKHISTVFENMQVAEPIQWSTDCFTVEVRFDFVVSRTYDTHTYPTAYTVAVRKSGEYKVVNIAPL